MSTAQKTVKTLKQRLDEENKAQLASAIGCSPSLLTGYVRRDASLGRRRFAQLAFVLGMTPEEVVATLRHDYPEDFAKLAPLNGGA